MSVPNNDATQPPTQPPAQPQTQPPAQPPARTATDDDLHSIASLQAAIDALPEKFAKSIAEAMPKPPKQTQPKRPPNEDIAETVQDKVDKLKEPEVVPGKKFSLGDWWFGK